MASKVMSQPLRIENPEFWSFGTSRTMNSRLWFVNNKKLEQNILRFLARYAEKYEVEVYGFVPMGDHYHLAARFPKMNRAQFYRDFNARIAELVRFFVPEFPGGTLFGRRYAEQAIVEEVDLEDYFFYCALQTVQAGLSERISDYPGYNSFYDAIYSRTLRIPDIDWARYNAKKKVNPKKARKKDFTTIRKLTFLRLPGYEHLSASEYKKVMQEKLEERRARIIKKRRMEGKGFAGRKVLLAVKPGAEPYKTKKSKRTSKRPLVLTKKLDTKKTFLDWYFSILEKFRFASREYRKGNLTVEFPPGTYRPPCFVPG